MLITRRKYWFPRIDDVEDILFDLIVAATDTSSVPGLAFHYNGPEGRGRLESALARPQTMAFGRYQHVTLFDKAAALFDSLINNHALIDGNKRLALVTTSLFLALNGRPVIAEPSEFTAFTLRVASPKETRPTLKEIAVWFRANTLLSPESRSRVAQGSAGLDRSTKLVNRYVSQKLVAIRAQIDAIESSVNEQ